MTSTRSYDARRRREGASRNRAAILAAFRGLLFEQGYRAATVRAVAAGAGVSAETVYKSFGGKPGLVKALWDTTLAGDDEPVAMGERPELRAVWAMPDQGEKLLAYAGFVRGVQERLAPLLAVLAQAGPDAADVLAGADRERLAGVTAFAQHLGAGDRVADAFWVLTGPQPYAQLVLIRGWTGEAYQRWLAGMLTAALGSA
jgi:AcrR family transcriptional regulator